MRRVVITGIGAISPHGLGAPALWNGLLESKSSIAPLTRFDPASFESRIAAVIPPFKTTDFVPKSYKKATKIMARDIELAVVAADFAVRDAKLITRGIAEGTPEDKLKSEGWFKVDPARMGCNIGAGLICADLDELTAAVAQARNPDNTMNLTKWGKSDDPTKTSGMENLTPLWLLKYLPNMLACHVSIIHDTQGPSNTITCGHSSAGLALAEATRTIQRNQADLALVGGCESKVHPMGLMRWSLLHRLNTLCNDNPADAYRPYDKSAGGIILSEGGAVFVIEELEHAKRRGATIYAEVAGFGLSASASANPIDPDPTGEAPAVAIKKAFKDSGVHADQIDMLVPSAYNVPEWDKIDTLALRQALGSSFSNPTVLLGRAGIGDCGAGSQALDLAAGMLAIHQQAIPPAPAFIRDPIDALSLPRHKLSKPIHTALVNMVSLGGQNCAVILKKVS